MPVAPNRVDKTHKHGKMEIIRRKREAKEAGRKFKKKGVGNEVEELEELAELTGPSGPVELVIQWG